MIDVPNAFRELTDEQRRALFALGVRERFPSDSVLIAEGTSLDSLFVLAKGRVRVVHASTGERSLEFSGPLGAGDVIGEVGFLDGDAASASLVADGPIEVVRFPGAAVRRLVAADPDLAAAFYRSLATALAHRLRTTNAAAAGVLPA